MIDTLGVVGNPQKNGGHNLPPIHSTGSVDPNYLRLQYIVKYFGETFGFSDQGLHYIIVKRRSLVHRLYGVRRQRREGVFFVTNEIR